MSTHHSTQLRRLSRQSGISPQVLGFLVRQERIVPRPTGIRFEDVHELLAGLDLPPGEVSVRMLRDAFGRARQGAA
jgi:hypothetical protein